MQLRRLNITTFVSCGIATHIGVESSARNARKLDFARVIAEDACSTSNNEQHQGSMSTISHAFRECEPLNRFWQHSEAL